MKSFSELRARARDSLRGNWPSAIVITLVAGIILNGVSYIRQITSTASSQTRYTQIMEDVSNGRVNSLADTFTTLSTMFTGMATSFSLMLLPLILGGAISYGLASYFLTLSRAKPGRKQAEIGDLFNGFKEFVSCFTVNFLVSVFSFLWSLLVGVVVSIAVVVALVIVFASASSILLLMAILFIIALCIGSAIVLSCILARYALVYYLMIDCEKANAMDYINESKEMMRGRGFQFFTLQFSFIGWYILGFLACCVGLYAVQPYVAATKAEYYNEILKITNERGGMRYLKLRTVENTENTLPGGNLLDGRTDENRGNGPSPY